MESIGNPTVQLEPWLPKLLDQIDPVRPNSRSATSPFPSLELRAVANVAVALREPWLHHDQLLESYNSLIFDREKLLNYYHEVSAVGSTNHGDTYLSKKAIRFSASALCKASTMALATNRMLQEFHPDDMELFAMGETLIREIIDLGDRILPIKPLGSAHLVPGLNIAWAATRDPKQKEYLARQLCDLHSCGYPAGVPLREARWWALKFGDVQRRLRKRGLLSPFSCSDDSYGEEEQEIPHEHCHVQ